MCKLKNYTFEDLDFIDICLFELGDNKTRAEIKAEIEKRRISFLKSAKILKPGEVNYP